MHLKWGYIQYSKMYTSSLGPKLNIVHRIYFIVQLYVHLVYIIKGFQNLLGVSK